MTTAGRPRHKRPPARDLQVLRTVDLTPSMRRITLGGEELNGFLDEHNGPNVKVFVPQPGQERPVLPVLDPETNRYIWPSQRERPTMRTYTVRRYDEQRGELDIDFVLHEHRGVASSWAREAKPGDRLGIMGPGGKTCRPGDWYLLVGDQTALPAISAIVEKLPVTARGQVFVEVADEAEEQHIECPPDLQWTWLHRNGTPAGQSRQLISAVQSLEIPVETGVSAWVAGESGIVRGIRRHLRNEWGLDPKSVLAIGYWKNGMAEPEYHDKHNHDRDY